MFCYNPLFFLYIETHIKRKRTKNSHIPCSFPSNKRISNNYKNNSYFFICLVINSYLLLSEVHSPQPHRRRIITFEFGWHIDTYFCNIKGHGMAGQIHWKWSLKIPDFVETAIQGVPKKHLFQILLTF